MDNFFLVLGLRCCLSPQIQKFKRSLSVIELNCRDWEFFLRLLNIYQFINWQVHTFLLLILLTVSCLDLVDSIVELAFSSPESPVEDRSEEQNRARVACSASLVHQVR